MNELPEGWEWKKLGEVCETTSGGTPNRKDPSFYGGNIPWVKSGELDKGLITDTEEKITESALKNSSAKVFPKGTLLIALYGATIGKLAFLGIDAATNQAICGIFENEKIDSKYLYQFLFYSKAGLVKQGIGGAQPNISQGILKNLDLPLPPLPVQHAIVTKLEAIFSELDHGVEQLKMAQQQLKVYRQAVLKWAFEGRLTNAEVRDGELVEGWTIKKLKEIGEWKGGGTPSKSRNDFWNDGTILWVSPKDMKSHRIYDTADKITIVAIENSSAKIIPKNSILIVVRSGILRRTLPVALTTSDVTVNQDLQALTPRESLPDFVYWYFQAKNDDIRKSCSKDGTTVESIESSLLKAYPIPLPPLSEQHQIVAEIERRLSVCDKLEETILESLKAAEVLRAGVLKRAFEGRLVP